MPDDQAARRIFPQPEGHHLAQLNLARAVDDLDRPAMAEFMAALDRVNAIAAKSPGYVWRLNDPGLDAAARALLNDPRETYTLSVWESAAALEFFAWNTVHRRFMNNRHKWFVTPTAPFLAIWWIPAGTTPDFADALARLEHLRAHGPSERAFGWKNLEGTRAWQSEGAPPVPPQPSS
ncbi:MAG: DUF3291 domain-containing protein [Pseudomonadota bacterium]|nr:DUF3291 domain-containing protein [Pseudomonadota bacterium]